MSWYLGQSWLIILLSFLLGLLLGWVLWRRPWHKRYFSESEAITRITRDHRTTVADKDAEIARLRDQLDNRGVPVAVGATSEDAEDAVEVEPDDTAQADSVAVQPVELVESAASVDVSEVEAPDVDVDQAAASVDVNEVDAPDVDVSDDATATAQVSALSAATAATAEDVEEPAPVEDIEEPAAAEEPVPVEEPARAEAVAPTEEPAVEDEEDDLERVEGIGPRINSALRAAEISTFERLAASDVAELQSALEAAGLRFAPSLPTWARQARLLADGDEEGFLQLTEQLVGGRDIGRRA